MILRTGRLPYWPTYLARVPARSGIEHTILEGHLPAAITPA